VRDRLFGIRIGWVVVGSSRLEWRPRRGRWSSVELSTGVTGLRLPVWGTLAPATMSTPSGEDMIRSMTRLLATEPFRELAPGSRRERWLMDCCSYFLCADGEIANNPSYAAVLTDTHLVCVRDGAPAWTAASGDDGPWPDESATTLASALMWLPDAACRAAVDRVVAAGGARSLSRADVEAGRWYGRRFLHVGPEADAVVLRPTKDERRELEAWLAAADAAAG